MSHNTGLKNYNHEQEMNSVLQHCVYCIKFKKPLPRSVAGLPTETQLNKTYFRSENIGQKLFVNLASNIRKVIVINNKLA